MGGNVFCCSVLALGLICLFGRTTGRQVDRNREYRDTSKIHIFPPEMNSLCRRQSIGNSGQNDSLERLTGWQGRTPRSNRAMMLI